jgi:hypothetical protein
VVIAPSPDEQAVGALVRERLALGRKAYGPLELAGDSRDFEAEAVEELLDATVYLACALIRRRRESSPGGEAT